MSNISSPPYHIDSNWFYTSGSTDKHRLYTDMSVLQVHIQKEFDKLQLQYNTLQSNYNLLAKKFDDLAHRLDTCVTQSNQC